MKPLHEALHELMASRGMSEHLELAAAADITPSTVSRYLSRNRGTRMNSQALATVEKLARALGVEPEYFLEYRAEKARRLVEDAVKRGEIDLEDIELVIERHKFMAGRESEPRK